MLWAPRTLDCQTRSRSSQEWFISHQTDNNVFLPSRTSALRQTVRCQSNSTNICAWLWIKPSLWIIRCTEQTADRAFNRTKFSSSRLNRWVWRRQVGCRWRWPIKWTASWSARSTAMLRSIKPVPAINSSTRSRIWPNTLLQCRAKCQFTKWKRISLFCSKRHKSTWLGACSRTARQCWASKVHQDNLSHRRATWQGMNLDLNNQTSRLLSLAPKRCPMLVFARALVSNENKAKQKHHWRVWTWRSHSSKASSRQSSQQLMLH